MLLQQLTQGSEGWYFSTKAESFNPGLISAKTSFALTVSFAHRMPHVERLGRHDITRNCQNAGNSWAVLSKDRFVRLP